MITFKEAEEIIKNQRTDPGTEKVELSEALHRVLAEDIIADTDIPPFNKSAVDGYACRREDLGMKLEVKEVIAAGEEPQMVIGRSECAKIMTGAKLPEGTDVVVMIEDTEISEDGKVICKKDISHFNIIYKAEDLHKGKSLLSKGTLIEVRHIPLLAVTGFSHPLVYRQPSAGIICTGSELIDASEFPAGSQIRNSNGPQLEAQCKAMNINVRNYGITGDSKDELRKSLQKSLDENDVTIISGGVSVGDFDYVPELIKEAGFRTEFHGIKVKPGKRMLFATAKGKYVFGLPGNPVSSFIQFELLIKPMLFMLQAANELPKMEQLILNSDYRIKNSQRTSFHPLIINADGTADVVEYHGSAHITVFTTANGFMEIPAGIKEILKGQKVNVRRL